MSFIHNSQGRNGISRARENPQFIVGPKKIQFNDDKFKLSILLYGDLVSNGFDVKLQTSSNVYYILQLQKSDLDRNFIQGLDEKGKGFTSSMTWPTRKTKKKISIEMMKRIFIDIFESGDISQLYFDSSGTTSRSAKETNGRKRRCVSDNDSSILHLKFSLSHRNEHIRSLELNSPVNFLFTFSTISSLRLYHLPDEIFIEIFKFFTNMYLLKHVNFVSKRFHQLVYSEYLFKRYFSRFFPNEKRIDESESYKFNTMKMYRENIKWIPTIDTTRSNEATKKIIVLSKDHFNEDFAFVCFTSLFVSPEETHEFIFRIQYLTEDDKPIDFYQKHTEMGITTPKVMNNPIMMQTLRGIGVEFTLGPGRGGSLSTGGGGRGWGGGSDNRKEITGSKDFNLTLCSRVLHIQYNEDFDDAYTFGNHVDMVDPKTGGKVVKHQSEEIATNNVWGKESQEEEEEELTEQYCWYVKPDESFKKVVLEIVSFKKLDEKIPKEFERDGFWG